VEPSRYAQWASVFDISEIFWKREIDQSYCPNMSVQICNDKVITICYTG